MNKALLSAALLSSLVVPNALAADFCGQIDSIVFKEIRGKISSSLILKNLSDEGNGESLELTDIAVINPQVVFKVARVVSKASVQDSKQLEKDLSDSNFEWDASVSDELHPNPYLEDFVVCLSAPLDKVRSGNILSEVGDINDIREDGYSILDLIY